MAGLIGERVAEALLDGPHQSAADGRVLVGGDPVSGVPPAECLDFGNDLVQPIDVAHHDRERLHQHHALLLHVGVAEEPAETGIHLEQARVEELGDVIGARLDDGPAGADQLLLGGGHRDLFDSCAEDRPPRASGTAEAPIDIGRLSPSVSTLGSRPAYSRQVERRHLILDLTPMPEPDIGLPARHPSTDDAETLRC